MLIIIIANNNMDHVPTEKSVKDYYCDDDSITIYLIFYSDIPHELQLSHTLWESPGLQPLS